MPISFIQMHFPGYSMKGRIKPNSLIKTLPCAIKKITKSTMKHKTAKQEKLHNTIPMLLLFL